MENYIMEHWKDIVYIVQSSKNINEASSRIQRQLDMGYLKAKKILEYPIIHAYLETKIL